jgi:hypothetical protein
MSSDIRGAGPGVGANPYVGPRALETGELLFGRDDEVVDLLNQLIADRVVLLYAVSGAGKTSLIRAGLLPGLESRGFAPLPVVQVRDEPPAGVRCNRYRMSVLQRLESARPEGDRLAATELAGMALGQYLRERLPKAPGGRVLIFDQFEDVLRIDPTDADVKEEFFKDVGAALREIGVWAVFSMREEYVAGLDPYLKHLPTRLASRFRLAMLSESAAKEAMCGPAAAAGVPFHPKVAGDLLQQLLLVKVQLLDGRVETKRGPSVEPVQLQVVCQLLWDRKPPAAPEIGSEALVGFSVDQALEQYYTGKVETAARAAGAKEAQVRRWVENKLITTQQLRGQVLKGPTDTEGLPNAVIDGLVGAYLVRAEQRLGGIWFELTHDRLVDPIRRNNREWFASRLQPFQLQADQWAARPGGERGALLLKGTSLADAEVWAAAHAGEVRETDKAFLEMSRSARTARDRIRTVFYRGWAVLSTVALLAGSALVWWALRERGIAQQHEQDAMTAAAQAREARDAAETARAKTAQSEGELRNLSKEREDLLAQARQQNEALRALQVQQDKTIEELRKIYQLVIDRLAVQAGRLATARNRETILTAGYAWELLYSILWPNPAAYPEDYKDFTTYMAQVHDDPKAVDLKKHHDLSLHLSQNLGRAIKKDESPTGQVFSKLRVKYYDEVTKVAHALADPGVIDQQRLRQRVRFEEYYWVRLALVESSEVSRAMVNFRNALPSDNEKLSPEEGDKLRGLVRKLEEVCRAESGTAPAPKP